MKQSVRRAQLLITVAILLALVAGAFVPRQVQAQSTDVCYAVADNGGPFGNEDTLVTLNRVTGVTTAIGNTGTNAIEAIAFAPGGGNLYAANNGQLGILDLTTGAFNPLPNTFGTGSGVDGDVTFNDVDGLDYDATTGILYGSHRRDGTTPDVLIQVDRNTGLHVADAFGPGVDYVPIDGPGLLGDIDDIAVDPITGVMLAASNIGGDGGLLIEVNKSTGASTVVGPFGVDDIEGLSYFNDGNLYGSTGKDGRDSSTRNQLYLIDESTGATSYVATFSEYQDYEALACLTGPTAISLAELSAGDGGLAAVAPTLLWLLPALFVLGALTFVTARRRTA